MIKRNVKKLSDKRKRERGFKDNKQLQMDVVKNNPDLSRAELSNILGVHYVQFLGLDCL